MSLLESLGISDEDLREMDPDRVEAEMASGGVIPEGKYHAVLIGAKKHDAKSGSEGEELEFEILAGQFRGSKLKDTLWKTDNAKGRNRMTMFANRLGLLAAIPVPGSKDKKTYAPIEGKSDWCDVLYAQCVIDVTIEEYEMTDKKTGKPNGKKGKANRLAFEGVFKLDDPRVKDVERAAGTIGVGSTTGYVPTSHAPKDDYAALGI